MMLTAGVIVSIIYLIKNYSILQLTYTLLIVLIIFYIIGSVLQHFINQIIINVENKEIKDKSDIIDEKIKDIEKTAKDEKKEKNEGVSEK
jgi:hypothetical protein